jgi:hypothetical protein
MMPTVSDDLHSTLPLALNNMAVSMLELGCITEALKTFKDSVCMMKSLMSPKEEDCSHQTACPDEIMQTAIQRLVKCQRKFESTGSNLRVDISAVDDGDVSAMRSALRYGPSFSMASPIRLRDMATKPDDLDIQAGIILYNMGLAHLLAYPSSSISSRTTSKPSPLLAGALKYLSVAHHVLVGVSDNSNDEYRSISGMLVDSLVLGSLFLVLQYSDQIPKARQVMATLELLKEAVADHDFMGYFPEIRVSAAA